MTRYIAIAASAAAIALLTWFAFRQTEDFRTERMAGKHPNQSDTSLAPAAMQEISATETQVVSANSQKSIAPQTEIKFTEPVVIKDEESVQEMDVNTGIAASESPAESIDSDEAPSIASAPVAAESKNSESNKWSSGSVQLSNQSATYTTNTAYIEDAKVIDYSALKDKKSAVRQPSEEKSIPSKYENASKKESAEADLEKSGIEKQRKINYLQLLKEPVSQYKKGQYETAIKGFDNILSLNAGDENARFYKGLCLFELARYDEAIALLHPIAAGKTEPFSQEAFFYEGKSYDAKGDQQQAVSIYRQIIASGGFYKEKAKVQLRKFEK